MGISLLRHTDGSCDWDPESKIFVGPQPGEHVPSAESRTADDWRELGMDQELNGKVVLALETYQSARTKYPQSFALEVSEGRLAASLQRCGEAAELLIAAQARDTSNAEIGYYLGVAEEGLGHIREAQTAYEIAYRQAAFRGRAAARIAELAAQRGDLGSAQKFLERSVEAGPLDTRTGEELEAITRALGDTARADELARRGLTADPTSDFLKEETGAPDVQHLAADPYQV
jgi:tetratricopeptide (TPR) repeat protein